MVACDSICALLDGLSERHLAQWAGPDGPPKLWGIDLAISKVLEAFEKIGCVDREAEMCSNDKAVFCGHRGSLHAQLLAS